MRASSIALFLACCAVSTALSRDAGSQDAPQQSPQQDTVLTGKAAFGSWKDDAPGVVRKISASDMPPANEQQDTANPASPIARPESAFPKLPPGYQAQLVAKDIQNPRALRVAPNGDLFVADSKANQIRVYRLEKGSGKVAENGIFAKDLYEPYGMAFYPPGDNPTHIYVANSHSVVRFPYKAGDMQASGPPDMILDNIPSAHHWTRDIRFSPDGKKLFVAVGSGSNVALDMAPQPFDKGGLQGWISGNAPGAAWDTEKDRAQVLVMDPDGKNKKTFAAGLRNCAGLAINPADGAPWCAVNERDGLGPDTPFEYVTQVKENTFYGWPWYYIGNHADDRPPSKRPDLAETVTVPDVLIQAHSAPLGITFYDGEAFPQDVKGDAFVALHGSWNRGSRTGYKVVRVPFENGKPTGEYVDFMTGFVLGDNEVWGRPVGLAVANDGALLLSEDGNGSIWRITYSKPQ